MNSNKLEYKKLSAEEMEKRGILGRLVGVCADFKAPTRNGRSYSEKLWEHVFNDPIMKERIDNGVCYGELGHPADRDETDMEKIAVCLSEVPKKGSDGKLRAVFDILNTPNGKILKTLCDYGSTLGISSRGTGEIETSYDGNEEVIPDSYTCEGFDVVLIPAVKAARLDYVTEGLDSKKSLRQALTESLNSANDEERKVMENTLSDLDITLSDDSLEESAMPRKAALDKCWNLGDQFIAHFDKIYNDNDEGTIKHHAAEMQNWLNQILNIKLRENNRGLSVEKIINYFLTRGSDAETLFKDNLTEADAYDDFIAEVVKDWNVADALRRVELLNEALTESDSSPNINAMIDDAINQYYEVLARMADE